MSFTETQPPSPIGNNIPEFTVAEISQSVRKTIELQFSCLKVRGEASGISTPKSGHIYFQLVQEMHKLDSVIWRSRAKSLAFVPIEGREYVATGKLTSYSGRSTYQLIIDKIEAAGEGELLARLERLKAKLESEGLFANKHKKPIPILPEVIGVVTSPGGAVIRDIQHVLRDRFPRHVLLWPAAVQGPQCSQEVAQAIRGFNLLDDHPSMPRPDLIIVARGGGSVEDLAGFSEEIVVRAAFESDIPLISAVGHETDWTLIDFASDLRAPTPSVAAEKAVPSRAEMTIKLSNFGSRMTSDLIGKVKQRRQRLHDLSRGLPRRETIFAMPSQRFDQTAQGLSSAMRHQTQSHRIKLAQIADRLQQPQIIQTSEKKVSIAAAKLNHRLIQGLIEANRKRLTTLYADLSRAHDSSWRERQQKISQLRRLLDSLSYTAVLRRGYAVVRNKGETVISTRDKARGAERLEIQFQDGHINVKPVADGHSDFPN